MIIEKCPLCGQECTISTIKYNSESEFARLNGQDEFYYVSCLSCGANNGGHCMGYKAKEIAVERWNKRVDTKNKCSCGKVGNHYYCQECYEDIQGELNCI